MITDWWTAGGCELFSDARAHALTARPDDSCIDDADFPGLPVYECEGCPGIDTWLAEQCGGDLADVTNAPWYDPARPETRDIRGIVNLGLSGIGGVLGSADADPASPTGRRRQLELSWAILANSDLAASAAVAWMADRLDNVSCAADCIGFDLCGLAGCPTDGDFEAALRTIPDVRLVSGPVVEQIDTFNAGTQIWQGTLIVETPNPYFLHVAPAPATLTLTAANSFPRTIDLNPDCPEPDECGADPDFPLPDLPDISIGTVDPAWPTAPYLGRGRDWSVRGGIFQRSTVGLRLTVETGTLPVRYLAVRLWSNPFGLECDDIRTRPNADCDTCRLLVVKYMPPRSTTVIDAARRHRAITCQGGDTGVPQMWGPDGGSFSWPLIHCGGGLCVDITVQGTLAPDASIMAEFLPMDGAA